MKDKELLKIEIEKAEAATKSFKNAVYLHEIIIKALKEELKKCN